MEIKEKISEWVDAHRDELLRDIGRLVAIKSVRGEPLEDAPFGPGPPRGAGRGHGPLRGSTALRRKYTAAPSAWPNSAHCPARWISSATSDVVGEGEGWDTDPYTATEKDDGCLYGRGPDDDKGPIVIAPLRHALPEGARDRAQPRLPPDNGHGRGVRLRRPAVFLQHECARAQHRDAGHRLPGPITPKRAAGRPPLSAAWAKSDALPRVSSLDGGFRVNVIPGDASAVVLGIDPDTALWAAHGHGRALRRGHALRARRGRRARERARHAGPRGLSGRGQQRPHGAARNPRLPAARAGRAGERRRPRARRPLPARGPTAARDSA